MSAQIKVLVVDDSSLVRRIIIDILESDPEIKVIGTAETGEAAVTMANKLDPDVITMDIEMPVMDGLTALKRIIATNPKPVIMMSVFTQHGAEETFKALEYGAVDFIPKPSSMLSPSVNDIGEQLRNKVKSVYRSRIASGESSVREQASGVAAAAGLKSGEKEAKTFDRKSFSSRIVGIGTSTGGPAALMQVFSELPKNFPSSILVVQHMPEGFTRLSPSVWIHCRISASRRPRTWIRDAGQRIRCAGDSHIGVEEEQPPLSGCSRVKRSPATGPP